MTFLLQLILFLWIFSDNLINCRSDTSFKPKIDNPEWPDKGLFPNVFNLASGAIITVNASCGETGPEVYCKIAEHVYERSDTAAAQCNVCDAASSDQSKRHPIANVIDGTDAWWQSPSLQNGKKFEWVTITVNLRQLYQIAYIIVKSAISPLPGNWILERSTDGQSYKPWQYFALTDTECWESYRIKPTIGKVRYRTDDEVICTSFYSKSDVIENGEIHTSLINGRPGADGPSDTLREFTKAQFIRLRLQRIKTFHADLISYNTIDPEKVDKSITRRLFYSIKDISIGGQCLCNGHARDCRVPNYGSSLPKCQCEHNTCGNSCEKCCPLFNQNPWKAGTSDNGAVCEECQCYGHSDECYFDQNIADKKISISKKGIYEGGGVCAKCKHHTTGINCEQCEDGYFRPEGVSVDSPNPCSKCNCSGSGVSQFCVKDDSHLIEGRKPGDCLCNEGFEGQKCDRCAKGYKNYPNCYPCSCNYAGIINSEVCDGNCVCKANVQGSRCNKCKNGFYNLDVDNPDGCALCYCFGATTKCQSSNWGLEIIRNSDDWMVSDLSGKVKVRPTEENGHIVIANDEMPAAVHNAYYWEAPEDYLGQNLYSYGNDLKFIISYVAARGDLSSGHFTDDADLILEGGPENLRIGFKWHKSRKEKEANATIIMPLREQNWFRVTADGKKSDDPVSREEFTLLIHDLKRLLIRAKFHTDQIEGGLYQVDMEKASNSSKSIRKAEGTEKCECPPGYAGLSCQYCEPGYRRVDNILANGVCEKCKCYNHAESCDPYTGQCSECLHNTTGPNCGECKPGFYGNAKIGLIDDCKPCACPLPIPSNNFSPTCRYEPNSKGYVCLECPEGYTGERCEICDKGYFGNPLIPGGFCAPCDCGPNTDTTQPDFCDHLTGQCKTCIGNTGGWRCDECLPQHYGNADLRDCKPCNCNPEGSLSLNCHPTTGQCQCKPNFTGRKCDRCAPGYGNLELNCVACNCDLIGSTSPNCDEVTGQCPCRPGVFGQHCEKCLDGHFGFSEKGCQWCKCDPNGAENAECNEITGQCKCKPFVIGRDCSHCEPGYWNIASGKGCEPCNCNFTGSLSQSCDELYGQCDCKPGVGGKHCDRCLPGYYGFSSSGCNRCDPCDAPGHICDPKTGRCVCPPNTAGPTCQDCAPGTWGFDVLTGCSTCDCNLQGSSSNECDHKTGDCICLEGFEGRHCDKCKFGYYRFPNCRRCDCHEPGTEPDQCRSDGRCQCDETGQCPCRVNVDGRRCDRCKDGAFALSAENPSGCFECFCFGKASKCEQSSMVWTQLTLPQREVSFEIGNTDIKTVHGFRLIPEQGESVGVRYVVDQPFYWSLPKEALSDQVLSYNGFIRFRLYSRGGSRFPENMLKRYPLIILQGNHRLVLHHFGPEYEHMPSASGIYQIRLHESEWIQSDNPQFPVTRAILMVALQKVQYILIRASEGADVKLVRLTDVNLDVAKAIAPSSNTAIGVEQCRCPPQYTAASCQDPNEGYYRKRKPNYLDSKDILDLVGWAEPCPCNNRSRTCDKETGVCLNCDSFTTGPFCNLCIKGYYGDPTRGIPCRPCACPTIENSFSDTCELRGTHDYVCTNCREGYTGNHCEVCKDGYWGNPLSLRGVCIPCTCSKVGAVNNICNKATGECVCKEGITGKDCENCPPRHIITPDGCFSCDDDCTGLLLDDIEFLQVLVEEANLTDVANLPWTRLLHLTNRLTTIRNNINEYQYLITTGHQILANFTISFDLETLADILYLKSRELSSRGPVIAKEAESVKDQAQSLLDILNDLWELIMETVNQLRKHGADSNDPIGHISDRILQEAERILRELQARDFKPRVEEADRELRKARNLLDRVRQLLTDRKHTGPLKERLDRLAELLRDILSIVQQKVQPPTQTAIRLVQESRPIQRFVLEAIENSTTHADVSNRTLVEARALLEAAKNALIEAAVTYDILPRLVIELDNGTHLIERQRSILARLNPEYTEKYVIPCQRHADDLMRQVLYLAGLFNATRDVAEYPLQAAKVYQKIIDALAAAEDAAKKAFTAAERAYKEAYPGTDDALTYRARKAKERSEQLLREAKEIRDNRVPELERELAKKRYRLDVIAEDVSNGKRNLDLISRALDLLPKDLSGVLRGVEAKLRNILDGLEDTHRRIDDIDRRIAAELLPKLDRLKAGTTSGIENLTKIIDQARNDIRDAARLAGRAEEIAERVNRLHNQMELNLKDLKDKILLARQKASSIRVSLGTDRSGVCMRSYEPNIQASISNNIVLNYAIKDEARDCLLFFIASKRADDFMAVEMVDRKIRFIWNAGGGTKMLAHSLNIETNDQQLLKDSQWYKIEVNRIGNVATLTVKRTPDGNKPDPFEISDTSPQGFNRMDLNPDSYFFIGELPPDFRPPRELRSRSFAGCLYELTLDGKQVGLWNFTTNKGCDGCKEGATEPKDLSTFQFKGEDSYVILNQIKRYDKKKYLVSLQFKTFDEDALLFFTANPLTGDFVSLFLQDGKVNYQFNIGNSARLSLTSKNKYNTGQWVRLDAEREKLEGVLSIVDEYLEGRIPSGSPTALELSDSELYFGGVTPNFTGHHWPSVVFKPFLGCIKDAQIDTTPLNLLKTQAFGVDTGCREKTLKVVSFKGVGYLQLNSEPLKEDADFSFTFKTTQSDALLLLSTFEGTKGSRNSDSHYYSISIVNGILEARFNGGVGETILNSEVIAVNDGAYHTVTVSKKIRKISLSLDDKEIGTTRLARGTKYIEAPTSGGLYLGGLPNGMSLKGMAATKEPLKGVIRDAVFNGKLLRLNEPISFEGVGIGRESDAFYSTNGYDLSGERMESMPAQLYETCAEMPQYSLETRAVKIGDAIHSHISLNRERKEFSKDFNLSFSFRTYYPNGLLFLIRGHNNRLKFHFALALRGGYIVADLLEKRRTQLISNNDEPLNDGQWHNVTVAKEAKSFWLRVDNNQMVETTKVRRKIPLRSPIYIGGIPEGFNGFNGLNDNDNDLIRESFKGCIKNFHINKEYIDLAGGLMHNVSECFTRIEKGAYFAGDGFAIFDERFNLGFKVDIELEFKTTRLNGILLSLSNGSDSEVPSLSIELFNGDIIASVDIGEGPFRAVKSFDSKYDMCDGKWHVVKVLYAKSSITLKVDKLEVSYGLKEKELTKLEPYTSAPLYIGGLPDFAMSGVLQQRNHFVGCMRNVAINDKRKDWISDIKLYSVLPNSCPTY